MPRTPLETEFWLTVKIMKIYFIVDLKVNKKKKTVLYPEGSTLLNLKCPTKYDDPAKVKQQQLTLTDILK